MEIKVFSRLHFHWSLRLVLSRVNQITFRLIATLWLRSLFLSLPLFLLSLLSLLLVTEINLHILARCPSQNSKLIFQNQWQNLFPPRKGSILKWRDCLISSDPPRIRSYLINSQLFQTLIIIVKALAICMLQSHHGIFKGSNNTPGLGFMLMNGSLRLNL